MPRLCRFAVFGYAALYALAFALLLVGTTGAFGSPTGPLAAVFLLPLGLPWNLWLDPLPVALQPAAAALAPAVSLLLLWALCHWRGRR